MSKKIIHYDRLIAIFDPGALLKPIDHPDSDNVSNTKEIFTSPVLSYDRDTGRIETLNTIYIPFEDEETKH